MTPVFIVNLRQDNRQRAIRQAQLARMPEFEPTFMDAVDGATLPDTACLLLAGPGAAQAKGTVACFLSHVRVWELIAALDAPYALVLEDDADIAQLRMLFLMQVPEDAEIIFINDRMSPNLAFGAIHPIRMATVLRYVDTRRGTGADGYLLTPAGARKLVAAVHLDLYRGYVDARLLRYASAEADLAGLEPDSRTANVILHHHDHEHPPALGLLKGYASSLPLVWQAGWQSRLVVPDEAGEPAADGALAPSAGWPEGFSDCFPAMPAGWRDHAYCRTALQSSHSQWSVGADAAADAARALMGKPVSPCAFHTEHEQGPWWQVDFEGVRPFFHVIVANRDDNPGLLARAVPLRGSISTDGTNWQEIFTTPEGLVFGQYGHQLVWSSEVVLEARFLRLTVPRRTYLHLRQVQVYGPARK